MRLSVWLVRNLICVGQSILLSGSFFSLGLALGQNNPALASSKRLETVGSEPNLAKSDLAKFEESVFGQSQPNLSFDERLGNLEKTVFGKVQTSDKATRMQALAKQLDLTASNRLQPALAPQLDTSHINKVVQPPDLELSDLDEAGSDRYYANEAPGKSSTLVQDQYNYGQESLKARKAEDRTESLLARATDLYAKGNKAAAGSLFRQVLATDPKNVDANYNLGAIAESEGNFNKALSYYKVAQATDPRDNEIRQAVASMSSKIQEQTTQLAMIKQEQATAQAAHKQQDNLKQIAGQASEDFRRGNYDQAILKLNQVVAQAPNDPDVHYALAQAWRGKNSTSPNRGNLEEARNQLKKAIALDPNNSSYRQALNDLNQTASGAQQVANAPGKAPFRDASSAGGYSGYGRYGQSQFADNSAGAGDIVPFSGNDLAAEPAGLERGYAYDMVPQSSGIASFLPAAGLGLGALMLAPQFFRGSDQPLRSNRRVKRMITDGIAGATMGAMMNRANGGSLKKGALFGGAVGLLFGGL